MELNGRVALVTGAGQGIGKVIATKLAEAGAVVGINDIAQANVDTVVEQLTATGLKAVPCRADVTSADEVERIVQQLKETYGTIDILVNNAGIIRDRLLVKMSEEDWDSVVTTNLKSYFLCARAIVPIMMEHKYGRIVNISSRAWLGGVGQANYSAAKGGVVSLTKTLAIELARYNITSNAIAPGVIDTPMYQRFTPEVQQRLLNMQPTGQVGQPEDVAFAALFFASKEAGYITGQVLHVCGGKSLGAYIQS